MNLWCTHLQHLPLRCYQYVEAVRSVICLHSVRLFEIAFSLEAKANPSQSLNAGNGAPSGIENRIIRDDYLQSVVPILNDGKEKDTLVGLNAMCSNLRGNATYGMGVLLGARRKGQALVCRRSLHSSSVSMTAENTEGDMQLNDLKKF